MISSKKTFQTHNVPRQKASKRTTTYYGTVTVKENNKIRRYCHVPKTKRLKTRDDTNKGVGPRLVSRKKNNNKTENDNKCSKK